MISSISYLCIDLNRFIHIIGTDTDQFTFLYVYKSLIMRLADHLSEL
jgi:hypothetical protein